jgi:uncharacterized damage-inducible protein DinB
MHIRPFVLTLAAIAVTATTAAAQNPVSDSLRNSWNNVKRNIKESAELMPEENYSFQATKDVRSFADILSHVAGASYMFCGPAKGEQAPFDEDSFVGKLKTKAEVVKATNDAIAYCDGAFAALTDATAGTMVPSGSGTRQVARVSSLIGQIGHDNEHYGNLVTYFRLKNLVPPSSRQR